MPLNLIKIERLHRILTALKAHNVQYFIMRRPLAVGFQLFSILGYEMQKQTISYSILSNNIFVILVDVKVYVVLKEGNNKSPPPPPSIQWRQNLMAF